MNFLQAFWPRFGLLLLPFVRIIVAHAQPALNPVDSSEIKALDKKHEWDFGDLGPFGGSGEGEEPPGYYGEWWDDNDGEHGGTEFHTGDDFEGAANDIVRMEIGSMNGGAIPKAIGKLRNLRELTIDYDPAHPLPAGLWSLPKLQRLTLRPRLNAAISPEIGKMKALRELVIVGGLSDTVVIPKALGNLANLERLALIWCSLDPQGVDFSLLTRLKFLQLEGMHLQSLPRGIGKLVVLDSLHVNGNELQQLPPEIGNLQQLTLLDLASNHLTTLPPEIGSLPALVDLQLQGNALIALPPEIGNLGNLHSLDVEHNQLTGLPESIGQLKALERLLLSSNVLTSLPRTMGGLDSLVSLACGDNRLATLPSSIGDLKRLSSLTLRGNPLTDLPPEFTQLEALEFLVLEKDGLLGLPRDTWEFINRFGGRFSSVPSEIAGKPLSYYLAHPGIDAYAKRYIQGDMALFYFEGLDHIQDSLCTRNPETAPFYLYMFARYWKPLDAGDAWFGLRSLFGSEKMAAAFVLQQPCTFISQVKNGPYNDLYNIWVSSSRGHLWQAHHEYSELFLALQAKMHADCGDALDRELLEFVQEVKGE